MPSPQETLEAIAAAIEATPWTPQTLEAVNAALREAGRGVPTPWGLAPGNAEGKAPRGAWLSAEQALLAWRDPERLGYDAASALYNASEALASAREALGEGAADQAEALTQLGWVADRLAWAGQCVAGVAEAVLRGDRG